MPRLTPFVLIAISLAAVFSFTQATGHTGAKGAVKTRMDSMGAILSGMQVLGKMSVGKLEFDQEAVKAAAATIIEHGDQVPSAFEKPEMSAISEANPAIWMNWDDFVAKAEDMTKAAAKTHKSSGTLKALKRNVGRLGKTCKSCHQAYRL